MNDRHEARLLLLLLSERWEEAGELARRPGLRDALLAGLARECEIAPWLHHLLERNGKLELAGERTGTVLKQARHKCRVDNLHLLMLAEPALDALLDVGTRPIALKGLDQIHRYGIDFGARAMVDMDLLVRQEELPRAVKALEAAGWTPSPEPRRSHWQPYHMALMSKGPVPLFLELHWNLVQPGRYRLRPEALFERAVGLEVCGRQVLGLEPHDHAAYLLLHHVSHYFERRLKGAVDLRTIAARERLDWSEVSRRLDSWGARAAGAMSLRHLAKLFPDSFGGAARSALRPGALRTLLTLPLRSTHPLDLFRGSDRRAVQIWLGAALLQNPLHLPRHLSGRG
jgi:hypothetical protein